MRPSRGMGAINPQKLPKTIKKRDGNEPVALYAEGGKATAKNPSLWSQVKAEAKSKFDVYPCVPLTARAITPAGLVYHDQVGVGDKVLAYDMETGRLVWSPVTTVSVVKTAPVIRLYKKAGFSLLCTPDHRWVVERTMSSGGKTGVGGHKGARTLCRELISARDLNTHMGIVWTGQPLEGSGALLGHWAKHDSWVPRVLSMTPSEREAFLSAAIVYDGCDQGATVKREGRTFGFTQKNEDHFFAAVLAAFCNGYYVSMYQKTDTMHGAVFIRGKRMHNTQNLRMEFAGEQAVWCPTTEHGTWAMVQDGVVCVTGNSAYANAWAAKEYKKRGGAWGGSDNRVKKRG